jgi:hypothetical protein
MYATVPRSSLSAHRLRQKRRRREADSKSTATATGPLMDDKATTAMEVDDDDDGDGDATMSTTMPAATTLQTAQQQHQQQHKKKSSPLRTLLEELVNICDQTMQEEDYNDDDDDVAQDSSTSASSRSRSSSRHRKKGKKKAKQAAAKDRLPTRAELCTPPKLSALVGNATQIVFEQAYTPQFKDPMNGQLRAWCELYPKDFKQMASATAKLASAAQQQQQAVSAEQQFEQGQCYLEYLGAALPVHAHATHVQDVRTVPISRNYPKLLSFLGVQFDFEYVRRGYRFVEPSAAHIEIRVYHLCKLLQLHNVNALHRLDDFDWIVEIRALQCAGTRLAKTEASLVAFAKSLEPYVPLFLSSINQSINAVVS